MRNAECREFLDRALPRMGFRVAGFRRVRGQVCKRIARRIRALGLPDLAAYRKLLDADPAEWETLDSLCRITISRFCRDRPVFEWLEQSGLPELAGRARAEGRPALRCWSAGCGGGEEAYTLSILWDLALADRFPRLRLEIIGTDADPNMLARARRGVYKRGCLREMPEDWVSKAFTTVDDARRLREPYRSGVQFFRQDIRRRMPSGPFDLVFCRNLVFTYFDEIKQCRVLIRIARRMAPGGLLVVGANERIPGETPFFNTETRVPGVYRLNHGLIPVWAGAVANRLQAVHGV